MPRKRITRAAAAIAALAATAVRSWHARSAAEGPEPEVDTAGEETAVTALADPPAFVEALEPVSYTHLPAHET